MGSRVTESMNYENQKLPAKHANKRELCEPRMDTNGDKEAWLAGGHRPPLQPGVKADPPSLRYGALSPPPSGYGGTSRAKATLSNAKQRYPILNNNKQHYPTPGGGFFYENWIKVMRTRRQIPSSKLQAPEKIQGAKANYGELPYPRTDWLNQTGSNWIKPNQSVSRKERRSSK